MNRRDELDAMYVILYKGCAGMDCMDCPGREYDHCGDYNKVVKLYDAGWHKQIEAEWEFDEPDKYGNKKPYCGNCGEYHLGYWSDFVHCNYCPNCGAKMAIKGEAI